jgi:hypothetical protein
MNQSHSQAFHVFLAQGLDLQHKMAKKGITFYDFMHKAIANAINKKDAATLAVLVPHMEKKNMATMPLHISLGCRLSPSAPTLAILAAISAHSWLNLSCKTCSLHPDTPRLSEGLSPKREWRASPASDSDSNDNKNKRL